ncbi:MAG TPA: OmpA family protein [Terriglobia bacterium]|nr:OmpA family protein [Terriglobia bacterium]
MQKLFVLLLVSATITVTSGCATKKYVRNTVKTSSDTLTARIEGNEGEIKEVRDNVDKVDQKVSGVDTKVSDLDSRTSEQFNTVRTDVQSADQKASKAQSSADRVAGNVTTLDQKFQNRNNFNVTDEKAVQFKFNSATLDQQYMEVLDEIANALMQKPDSIVVLEGRTDNSGAKDYNVKLGERRIEAVRRYLAVEKGVPVYRIHDISFGAEKPVAENKTKEGREKNRAVTMTILVPKTEGAVATENN